LNSDSKVKISVRNPAFERIGDALCGSLYRKDRVTGIGEIRFRRMA
jgi:hypothetical protein